MGQTKTNKNSLRTFETAKIKMYADDVVMYANHYSPEEALHRLQHGLNHLGEACKSLGLTINEENGITG